MSIFLLILKIIGIILLSIISLLLIIIALILFVPIRYRIIANKFEDSDFYAEIKLTWLLHFINILIKYTDDLYYRVRVILIPIKKSDNLKKHKNNSKKTEPYSDDTKSVDEGENISDESANEDISDNEISKDKEEIVSTSDLDENDDDNINFDENKGNFTAYFQVTPKNTKEGFSMKVSFKKDSYTVHISDNVSLEDALKED